MGREGLNPFKLHEVWWVGLLVASNMAGAFRTTILFHSVGKCRYMPTVHDQNFLTE
jgi:hypothetical protein